MFGPVRCTTKLGLTARGKPTLDGSHGHVDLRRDLARRHAGLPQAKDFHVALATLVSPQPAQARERASSQLPPLIGEWDHRCPPFRESRPCQRHAALRKTPAVGDLSCIGSPTTGAVGVGAGAVARHDLDARMASQP